MSGRYEAWGVRPEGSYRVSCQDDMAVAFADAAAVGASEVYDTVERRWVDPEDGGLIWRDGCAIHSPASRLRHFDALRDPTQTTAQINETEEQR